MRESERECVRVFICSNVSHCKVSLSHTRSLSLSTRESVSVSVSVSMTVRVCVGAHLE